MAQRNINDIDKTILDNFYKLVHDQPSIRLRAATSTFKILHAFQKQNNPKFNENLNYCIERLVLGLSSSRAQARRGYSVLLLELLKHHQITTERLLSIAHQKFGPINKDTSKDELIGYFLLNTLILGSGNISKSKANMSSVEKIYKSLINLHKVKSYFDVPVCHELQKNLDLFYDHMLADIPEGAFNTDYKNTSLDLMIIGLCNSKQTIKQFVTMDNSKLQQIMSTLRLHNLKMLPLHPLLIVMSEAFVRHFPQQFEAFYKEVIVSQTDIMKELINVATKEILVAYIDQMVNIFVKKSTDRDRGTISQVLVYAIRRPQVKEEVATITKVVKICMINSMFRSRPNIDRKSNPVVQSYHGALDCLVSICNPTQRVEKLNELLETVKLDYFKDPDQRDLWKKFHKSWESQREIVMSENNHRNLSSIASLYLFYGLQVIEHSLDCEAQLEELNQSAKDVIEGDPTDGSWADILTDQIIAILSATECNPWIRNLCDKVFGNLLPHISQTSVDLLCDALAPHNEEEDEDESDGCGSEDQDSYVESDGEESDADIETKSLGSDANDSDSHQSVESNGVKIDDEIENDAEYDMDVDESDEEYMDDEQMMRYDKVLADMFRLRRLDKKKDSDKIAFKLRLLDLVKRILTKRNKDQETIAAIVAAIIPLAKSCRSSKESLPIYTKVKGVLSKMPGKAKYPVIAKFLEKT